MTKLPAREGQWPRISRYETSTGDGFTIAGSVTALNQVGMLEMGWLGWLVVSWRCFFLACSRWNG